MGPAQGRGARRGVAIVRRATADDARALGRLLHDFNTEYDDFTPGPDAVAARVRALLGAGAIDALVAGEEPCGLAVLRFRASLWKDALECHLEELYVVPALRGRGIGRALVEAALELARERGAWYIDVATGADDVAARSLYEKVGFSNREREPDGPAMLFYERLL